MKSISFSKLAIGQQFEFQDSLYIKISPIIARGVDDDAQRLIPRSAQVIPHDNKPQPAATPEPIRLNGKSVADALEAYHQCCRQLLEDLAVEKGSNLESIREALEKAYHDFYAATGLQNRKNR